MTRRSLDAALLLDKPAGMSSNAALQAARRLYGAQKAGHGGTLDPLASGLLPVLFGEATKFAGPLLDADKEYIATVKLGERTSTGDAEGEVVERKDVTVSDSELDAALDRFRGEMEQLPPMYSALKHQGTPLYRLARKGKTVERKPRKVRIEALELLGRKGAELTLRVRCSKGTYVRVLAEDIGAALGTVAHLGALRRIAAGRLRIEDAAGLDRLAELDAAGRERHLLALPRLLEGLPRAELDAEAERRFRNGQSVPWGGPASGPHGVYRADGSLIGLGQPQAGNSLRPLRLTAAHSGKMRAQSRD